MNVLTKISQLKDLTNNERALVDFIMANPEKIINYRPNEIAAESFVSVATIYRLVNKLGLSGLGELKIELISTLKMNNENADIDFDYPILESDTPFQMMQNLGKIYKSTVDETISYVDPEVLVEVGKELHKAKMIDVYTASANLFFAKNFKFQMQEIGVMINVPEEDYIQNLSAANSDQDHIAIIVSFGGRGQVISAITKILYENNVDIVLITSTLDNPLNKYAKHKIYFASAEDHYNKISSFSTRLSLLYIFDTLYSVYFNKDYERNIKYKLENYKKINKELK